MHYELQNILLWAAVQKQEITTKNDIFVTVSKSFCYMRDKVPRDLYN